MDSRALASKADSLRALHVPGQPLLLVNAWDAASAVIVARAGAKAIATSSSAAANAAGRPDGQRLTRGAMLAAVAQIAAAVDLPVTADMEAGYGDTAEDAAATAQGVIGAGAVGFNLEDTSSAGSADDPLLPTEQFVAKIVAIRAVATESGVPLVLNARTDIFLAGVGDPSTRLERALARGRAYLDAGADCFFVPGVADPDQIAALVERSGGPVSVLAMPGSPSLTELAALGVARVSVGSGLYRAALALAQQIAREVYDEGTLATMVGKQVEFTEAQALFS